MNHYAVVKKETNQHTIFANNVKEILILQLLVIDVNETSAWNVRSYPATYFKFSENMNNKVLL